MTYLLKAKTKDNNDVHIGVNIKGEMNLDLEEQIIDYVKTNLSSRDVINNLDVSEKELICNNKSVKIKLKICFILEWNHDYSKIINANYIYAHE